MVSNKGKIIHETRSTRNIRQRKAKRKTHETHFCQSIPQDIRTFEIANPDRTKQFHGMPLFKKKPPQQSTFVMALRFVLNETPLTCSIISPLAKRQPPSEGPVTTDNLSLMSSRNNSQPTTIPRGCQTPAICKLSHYEHRSGGHWGESGRAGTDAIVCIGAIKRRDWRVKCQNDRSLSSPCVPACGEINTVASLRRPPPSLLGSTRVPGMHR